ncbi:hypothetical protein BJ508DRAFT_309513 [Ascobolus immersus RN42]|uniref:Uncharacterized protein n=1 Tax=Ascobolus immersus RN42 TaxID=1160509 RepID=A0A3N4HWW5_ASCIM|nr:hypothetical protein BJ508DRAFT_309513 [Ascobolus immersus RN42]
MFPPFVAGYIPRAFSPHIPSMSLHPLHPPLTTLATTSYLISIGLTTHSLLARPSILSIHDRYPSPLSPYAPLMGMYFVPQQLLQGLWLYRLWKTGGSTTSWLRGVGPESAPLVTEVDDDEDEATLVADDEADVEESRLYASKVPEEILPPAMPITDHTALPYPGTVPYSALRESNTVKKRTALSTAFYLPIYTLSNLFFILGLASFRQQTFVLALVSVATFTAINAVFVAARLGNLGLNLKGPPEGLRKCESRRLEVLLHWVVKGNVGLGCMLLLEVVGVLYLHHSMCPLSGKLFLGISVVTVAALSDVVLGVVMLFTSFALAMGQTGRWGAQLFILALIVGSVVGIKALVVALTESHVVDPNGIPSPSNSPPVGKYGALDVDQATGANTTTGLLTAASAILGSSSGRTARHGTSDVARGGGTPGGGDPRMSKDQGVGVSWNSEVVEVADGKDGVNVKAGFGGSNGKRVGSMPDGPVRKFAGELNAPQFHSHGEDERRCPPKK